MQTERQWRQGECLETLEDYLELIKQLDETAGEVANGEAVDKHICRSISTVSRAMRKKVEYIVGISKKYRKKQGFLSVRKDLKTEKEYAEQEAMLELMKKQHLTALPEPPKKTFFDKIKAIFTKKQPQQALPEQQEDPEQPEVEETEPECEVLDQEQHQIEGGVLDF